MPAESPLPQYRPPPVAPRRVPLLRRFLPDSFGAEPGGERLRRIHRSPQFRGGSFRNTMTRATPVTGSALTFFRDALHRPDRLRRHPVGEVTVERTPSPRPPDSGLRLTWLGHASALAEIDGHRVLFDPVWGARCSPFRFVGPRRLHAVPLPLSALGKLDAVVISHDHYDHLDLPTVRALAAAEVTFAVPLGVGAHLEHWGAPPSHIIELDWYESATVGGLTLTATPGRHFCGRGLRRQALTLWASWAVAGPTHRIFHSGDSGYCEDFARIGARVGPFDATMMQIGAYSSYWPDVHMTPEEGVSAHRDVAGGVLLPIHWGTFNLALHSWDEPAERVLAAGRASRVPVALPRPGEAFEPAGTLPVEPWWRPHAARPARSQPLLRKPGAAGEPRHQWPSRPGDTDLQR